MRGPAWDERYRGATDAEPSDIPVGRVAVVTDPCGNPLVLLDLSTGTYRTDAAGNVTGDGDGDGDETG